MSEHSERKRVLIVGGGAGGLTVAALLRKARRGLDITVIEPAEHHFYQPAWTLVGAGEFAQERTRRPMAACMPPGVTWTRASVAGFAPADSAVTLSDGRTVGYDALVVAAGLKLDWGRIAGLEAALGQYGVTSNYRYDLAPYTARCIGELRTGQALFTQPAMPIKCAGAPQKILYMAADRWRRAGVPVQAHFLIPGAAIFGVPFYAQALDRVVAHYGITPHFGHTLVEVDGPGRRAVFETTADGAVTRHERPFDLLHVVPPQCAPDFIRTSALADAGGWLAVDQHTLRHVDWPQVWGLGDCTSTPNSKTAAAVRAQAPVLAANLLAALDGHAPPARYDGYASCPLTTSVGRIMLAEFQYGGVVAPSFPFDPRVPRRAWWWLKKHYLPWLYWRMLRGHLGLDWHRERAFAPTVPALRP